METGKKGVVSPDTPRYLRLYSLRVSLSIFGTRAEGSKIQRIGEVQPSKYLARIIYIDLKDHSNTECPYTIIIFLRQVFKVGKKCDGPKKQTVGQSLPHEGLDHPRY